MHINLIIATPGHSVMVPYLKSLLATIPALQENEISWAFTSEYSSHVGDAREVTLSGTFDNNPFELRPLEGRFTYDKILWIDSDIAFLPEHVIKIYKSPYDITTGAYLQGNGQVMAYKELMGSALTYPEVLEMNDPIKIFSAGMGFMAVKSGVFESLSRPWFQSPTVTVLKDEKEVTFPIMGEDISFCHRANEAGFEVWLDPSIKLQHHKTMKLTWEGIKP